MTDMQTAQITTLRTQGKGYKAIASAVGLSRDIVRNYCKANGMNGFGEEVALNLPNRKLVGAGAKRISDKSGKGGEFNAQNSNY